VNQTHEVSLREGALGIGSQNICFKAFNLRVSAAKVLIHLGLNLQNLLGKSWFYRYNARSRK
jgi:hypothetical protein